MTMPHYLTGDDRAECEAAERIENEDAERKRAEKLARRAQARAQLSATAWAIKVGNQWFAGFGGHPRGPYLTKLRPHLADAKLCVSPERAADYVDRLDKRGYPGATVHTIKEA